MITKKEQEANELKHFNKAAGKLSAVALSAGALALSCPTYAFASQEGGRLPNMVIPRIRME